MQKLDKSYWCIRFVEKMRGLDPSIDLSEADHAAMSAYRVAHELTPEEAARLYLAATGDAYQPLEQEHGGH